MQPQRVAPQHIEVDHGNEHHNRHRPRAVCDTLRATTVVLVRFGIRDSQKFERRVLRRGILTL